MTQTHKTINTINEYRGITWNSNKDLSKKLGKCSVYVYRHRTNNESYEKIIDDVLDGNIRIVKFKHHKNNHGTYRDITWISNIDLAKKLGKGPRYIYTQRAKGRTYEEIIDTILNSRQPKSYRDIIWYGNVDLAKKLGKETSYINRLLNNGKTYEDIIDTILNSRQLKSYRGFTWSTDIELSKKLGKNRAYVGMCIYNGYTREQIIDDYLLRHKTYRGVTWSNDTELSKKLGRGSSYVRIKRKSGLTHHNIIDEILDGDSIFTPQVRMPMHTYKGIVWISKADLSRKLDKSETYVGRWLKKGKTYEEIIDMALNKTNNNKRKKED